jgi:hypothetical protein
MHPMFAQLFLETGEDDVLADEEDRRRRSRRARRQTFVKSSAPVRHGTRAHGPRGASYKMLLLLALGHDGRSSSRKPTLSFTWKWQRVLSSIRPLMSVTSNQSRLCRVFDARPMAPLIASSMLSAEVPTISLTE